MSPDSQVARPRPHTFRGGWGWLLLGTAARCYLAALGTMAACGLVPMLFGLSGAVIQSSSMEPHISRGDVVLSHTLPADARTPVGRIVTFRAPTGSATPGLILHRLVAMNEDGTLVTAGDANPDPDSTPLARRDIVSQGCLLVPWIGLPSIWLGTGAWLPLGMWLLLTIGALVIAVLDTAASRRPPVSGPDDLGDPSDPDSGASGAVGASSPRQQSISARFASRVSPRLTSLTARIRVDTGSASVGLVAVFTTVAMAMAPLSLAAAAFTATVGSDGSWMTAGPATRLAFTTDPSDSTSGVAFDAQPVVVVLDAEGQTVGVSSAPVTLSLTTPAGATLTCTANPQAAAAGVATFDGCSVDAAGTYTLTASSGKLTSATSARFTIAGGDATTLSFTASPSSSTSNVAFKNQPVVAVQDAHGNTVTTSTAAVTLTITEPAGATLTCKANPQSAVAGIATFAGCGIDKAGRYTLTATSDKLTSDTSTDFTIAAGPATQVAFTTNPSSSNAGVAFGTQPVVTVQDAAGNTVISSSVPVTLTLTTPAGATLACTANPQAAVAGVVGFAGCKVDKPGTYTLSAAATGLTGSVSASFTITAGPATKLVFTTNPSSSTGGTTLTTQPVVTVQDAAGFTVTTSTAPVTLALTTPGGATLTCTQNPTNATAGVATFAGCKVDKSGTYTLTASSSGLTNAVSTSFTISVGAASILAFTTSPSNAARTVAFATQPVVKVQDAGGNTVTTSTASVTLALTTPAGAILTCTANPKAAVAGVDTFAGCKVDRPGTYTLTATATGLASGVSASFTITAGAATKLAFTTSPSSSTGGTAFATQPVVTVQDAGGFTVTTSAASVTLTLTTPAGAVLTCTANPKTAVAGVDTFAGCKVDKTGTYTLSATSSGLTSAVSTSFTITAGPAAKLAFTTNPSSSTGGAIFTTQPVVTVQDAGGNTVTTSSASVALALTTPGGATLTCTQNSTTAASGVATFAGCKVDKTGTYTLTASSSGLTNAVSTSFTISVGVATTLVFSTSPSNAVRNVAFGTQPVVTVKDAGGNTVTSSVASITLSIGSGPGGSTLTCTANPKAAVSGVATFAGCRINTAGTFTLGASASGGLKSAISNQFTIS